MISAMKNAEQGDRAERGMGEVRWSEQVALSGDLITSRSQPGEDSGDKHAGRGKSQCKGLGARRMWCVRGTEGRAEA